MPIVKVIEVLAESEQGWEDAAKKAIEEASRTVRNIRSLYVENMQVTLKNGAPRYRLDAKISFEIEEEAREKAIR